MKTSIYSLSFVVHAFTQVGKYFDALLIDCEVEDSPFDCFNEDDVKVELSCSIPSTNILISCVQKYKNNLALSCR